MKKMKFSAIVTLFTMQAFGQNIVCFDIVENPHSEEPAFALFTKYIDVFGIGIYAEESVSDEKVKHTAAIFAEWLDNDEDGIVDDSLVLVELLEREALMPIFSNEGSPGETAFFENYMGEGVGAVLYDGEIVTSRPLVDSFDATIEENLHTISSVGYANAYPLTFAEEETSGSGLTDAMDISRGGHFISIPDTYPESAWYHYDDETCEYNCMATEYFYWGLTSMLGIQDYGTRCADINVEWEACTALEFETIDTALFNLFSDPIYNIPTYKPDGNYCPENLGDNDLIEINRIVISPNPASRFVTIQIPENKSETAVIYDLKGNIVLEIHLIGETTNIDLKNISNGTYLLVTNKIKQKLIINKK